MFARCKTQPEAVSCGFIVEKYKNFYENCDLVMIIMTIKIAFTFIFVSFIDSLQACQSLLKVKIYYQPVR